MMQKKQKILILGLGYFERRLIQEISRNWQVLAVDHNEDRIKLAENQIPSAQYVRGDVSSILTWKKLDLSDLRFVISTIRDRDVNLEVCRIVRETLRLKQPIMILVYDDGEELDRIFEPYEAVLIKPVELGIHVIRKKLEKNVSQAINIGLGKGEILEVHVLSRSHLVGHKLKHLRPSQWHIAAIYHDNKLTIPTGNNSIQVGDRVVLVGDPNLLENVAEILIKGNPQFPLQYGTDIVFPLHRDYAQALDEASFWKKNFKAQRLQLIPFKKKLSKELNQKIKSDVRNFEVGETIEVFREIFQLKLDTGVLIVPPRQKLFHPSKIKASFKFSSKPFLVARNSFPYKGIIISLNGPDPALALDTGIEIASMLKIPIKAVYTELPKEMRGVEEVRKLKKRQQIIADFEGIRGESISYQIITGNPVLETLTFTGSYPGHLLVMDFNPALPPSFLKPNVPYMIARHCKISTLMIPAVENNE